MYVDTLHVYMLNISLQFKGFDPYEMVACTLLFEGSAEVSVSLLYWGVLLNTYNEHLWSLSSCVPGEEYRP